MWCICRTIGGLGWKAWGSSCVLAFSLAYSPWWDSAHSWPWPSWRSNVSPQFGSLWKSNASRSVQPAPPPKKEGEPILWQPWKSTPVPPPPHLENPSRQFHHILSAKKGTLQTILDSINPSWYDECSKIIRIVIQQHLTPYSWVKNLYLSIEGSFAKIGVGAKAYIWAGIPILQPFNCLLEPLCSCRSTFSSSRCYFNFTWFYNNAWIPYASHERGVQGW